jgi:molecular chaperone Hsp33
VKKKSPTEDQFVHTPAFSEKDRIYPFLLEGVNVRGALIHGTHMVAEMRAAHELGPLETLLLGHAYLAAGLLTANMKGGDRMNLRVECDGPARGFSAEANARGDVRGYLLHNPVDMEDRILDDYKLASIWGAGTLALSRYPEGSTTGFTGRVELEKGSLAVNLARYYLRSEQTPTAFVLSIKFDRQGKLLGAGGLFLQTLPGADDRVLEEVENRLVSMDSVASAFAEGKKPAEFLDESFGKFFPRILASNRIEFFCPCGSAYFSSFIGALPLPELEDMAEKGPFPVTTTCHNCNSTYEFAEDEIRGMLKKRQEV